MDSRTPRKWLSLQLAGIYLNITHPWVHHSPNKAHDGRSHVHSYHTVMLSYTTLLLLLSVWMRGDVGIVADWGAVYQEITEQGAHILQVIWQQIQLHKLMMKRALLLLSCVDERRRRHCGRLRFNVTGGNEVGSWMQVVGQKEWPHILIEYITYFY